MIRPASILVSAISPLRAILAQTHIFDQAGIGAAILLTLIGMVLHWHLPRHRMSMEERMKDGKMTEEEARRQIRFYGWCAPIATVAGIVVMVAVLFDMTS